MTLNIPIQEAITLIKDKSGKDVSLKVVDKNTITVGYTISKTMPLIGSISKKVDVNVTIDKVIDNNLYLRYATGVFGGDMILNKLLSVLPSFTNSEIVDKDYNGGLIVHLNKIKKIQKFAEQIELKSISFGEDSVISDFIVK
jgi:hypothetical protein